MATVSSSNPFAEGVERFCSGLVLSDEKFEEMSAQAARDLRENKAAYFRRVMMMAALGYGYITFIVGSMVVFVVAIAVAMWVIGNLSLPHAFCVITFDGDTKKLKEKVLAVENSQVYDKKFPRVKVTDGAENAAQ